MKLRKTLVTCVLFGFFFMLIFATMPLRQTTSDNGQSGNNFPLALPNNAAGAVDFPFNGTGNSQEIRVFGSNTSVSLNHNGSFPIPAISSNSALSHADMNLTFNSTDTTLYPINPYSALDYPRVLNGTYYYDGVNPPRFADAVVPTNASNPFTVGDTTMWHWAHDDAPTDNPMLTYTNYTSIQDFTNRVSLDVYSNFSKLFIQSVPDSNPAFSSSPDWVFPGNGSLIFNSSMCLALDLNFTAQVNVTGPANYVVQAENQLVPGTFDTISTGQLTNNITSQLARIVNPGSKYINSTQGAHFRVNCTFSTAFNFTLYDVNATVKVGEEVEVSDQNWVALEFDLLGNATEVNGFQVLMRTINAPGNVLLKAALYRANTTTIYSRENTFKVNTMISQPAFSVPLATYQSSLGNTFNGLVTINFSTPATLNSGNYFIVLNTTAGGAGIFHLLTMPYLAVHTHVTENSHPPWPTDFPQYTDWDPTEQIRHVLLNCSATGNWGPEYLNPSGSIYQLSAAPFAINVTRAWVPTDVNLTIQNVAVASVQFPNYLTVDGNPVNLWGNGTWSADFPTPITPTGWAYSVPLSWDQTITTNLWFNVSYYANAYASEYNSTFFNVTAGQVPNWIINYTIHSNTYQNYTFAALEFTYPNSWAPNELIAPNYTNIFLSTDNILGLNATSNAYKATNGSNELIVGGTYSLQLTSFNFIRQFNSYLNFNSTNFWPSDAFMQGDNISTEITVQSGAVGSNALPLSPVMNGTANVTLYYGPTGSRYSLTNGTLNETTWDQIANDTTFYRFKQANILNSTNSTPYGQYIVNCQWANGTEVGFIRGDFYILNYTPKIDDVQYDPTSGLNVIYGSSGRNPQRFNNYSIIIATVNETTGLPKNTLPPTNLTIGANTDFGGVELNWVTINATVFHRGDPFEVNVSVVSNDHYTSDQVQVQVSLVYYLKEEWVIWDSESNTTTLNQIGTPGDTALFNFTGTFPTGPNGENCPLREAPVLLQVSFSVNTFGTGTWEADHPFIQVDGNDTAFEGQELTTVVQQERTGATFQAGINRTLGCILPGVTNYFVSIIDANGTSTQSNVSLVKYDKCLTVFGNLTTNPTIPTANLPFTLSGDVSSEIPAKILSSKTITFSFMNLSSNSWATLNGVDGNNAATTDAHGHFTEDFNASAFLNYSEAVVRLSYAEDAQQLSQDQNFTIDFNIYALQILVQFTNNTVPVGNQGNYVTFSFMNVGNATLANLTIQVVNSNNYTMTLVSADFTQEMSLAPGEELTRTYLVAIPVLPGDEVTTFTFTINAQARDTLQVFSLNTTVGVFVAQGEYISFSAEFLALLAFFVLLALVWFAAIRYFVRKSRAEAQAEEAKGEGIPKRKFVKVEPQEAKVPAKKGKPAREVPEEVEKPGKKDFDEILREVKKDEGEEETGTDTEEDEDTW